MEYNYKKHPIKVKHRKKNLYNKKKSKAKRVWATVLTIAAAAALCVVGYGLGRPLLDYINAQKNNTSENVSAWTPPEPQTAEPQTASSEAETTVSEPVEEPTPEEIAVSYILPDNAALSSESLKSAIAYAKNSGCNSVTVTLKGDTGRFLYKSSIDGIKDSDIIDGALTARQICSIIEQAGLIPAARINTLKDHCSGNLVDNTKFELSDGWGWLDNAADRGGKSWLNPFNRETSEYLAAVTDEITQAGFKTVILTNTVFPMFSPSDYTTYLSHLPIGNASERSSALWSVLNACKIAAEKNGAAAVIELNSEDLSAEDKLGTTAELTANRADFNTSAVLLNYTPDSTLPSPAAGVTQFLGKMNGMYPGMEYSVRIANGGFSAQASEEVRNAFAQAKISVYVG
ncbi:MAG: putative glycoside hydrolase [Oscillospiraceae bacterium]